MTGNDNTGKRVGAVERAFGVVSVLRESGPMRITDVASELEMPTSTAHVHLKTLADLGYAVKTPEGYRLSLRFLRDGSAVRSDLNVYTVAKQEIDDLAWKTGEVANLGVEEDGQRVILYQSEGDEAVYDNALVGEFTHMHWTALGKALLAEYSKTDVEQIVDRHGLPTATTATIDEIDTLHEELDRISENGFALEDEERRDGIRSIAVPIVVESRLAGAISLSGPKERFDDERIHDELLPALRDCANVIEVRATYQ